MKKKNINGSNIQEQKNLQFKDGQNGVGQIDGNDIHHLYKVLFNDPSERTKDNNG